MQTIGNRRNGSLVFRASVIAAVLLSVSGGLALANANSHEELTAETWIQDGNIKGQIRYTLGDPHYSVCVVAFLYYRNESTYNEWVYSWISRSNCNDNHNVSTAQGTATATNMCPGTGDTDWQVRGFGEAYNRAAQIVHRQPDTGNKWGNVVTRRC